MSDGKLVKEKEEGVEIFTSGFIPPLPQGILVA